MNLSVLLSIAKDSFYILVLNLSYYFSVSSIFSSASPIESRGSGRGRPVPCMEDTPAGRVVGGCRSKISEAQTTPFRSRCPEKLPTFQQRLKENLQFEEVLFFLF